MSVCRLSEGGPVMALRHFRFGGALARWAPSLAAVLLLASQAPASSAQNLLTNPDFDTSLSGWLVFGSATWDGALNDAGAPGSGSAEGVFDSPSVDGLEAVVGQCVPLVIGLTYRLGGDIYISPGQTATGGAFYGLVPFPSADCSGAPPPGAAVDTPLVTVAGIWTNSSSTFTNSFAQSGQLGAYLAPSTGGLLQANYDNTVVATAAPGCNADAHTLCLLGSRFAVTAVFRPDGGSPSAAQAVPIGNSGYFWFFDAGNVEVMAKVIDGCALGGHFWFFAAGLTNVQVAITVIDTSTGAVHPYANPADTAFQPIQDTAAFSCP